MKHHERYIRLATATVGLRDKDVLEIGGCTPIEIIERTGCRSWTSVNLNRDDVDRLDAAVRESGNTNVTAHFQDAATINAVAQFDVVYSVNSFEHIQNLAATISAIVNALRTNGKLFAIFGPIWSSDVGHHLSVEGDTGLLHFNDRVLLPFEHLMSTPDQMRQRLLTSHSMATADRIVEWVYSYPDINRLTERQYEELRNESRMFPLLVLRRHGERPAQSIGGASSTREMLWVMSKNRRGLLARVRTMAGFLAGFAWARYGP